MKYYPTKHAKERFMERFKGNAINEFEASTMLKESLDRSQAFGQDLKRDYIKFHWDPHFNNVLVVNDLNKTIITTFEFKRTFLQRQFQLIAAHPPVDKVRLQYLSER